MTWAIEQVSQYTVHQGGRQGDPETLLVVPGRHDSPFRRFGTSWWRS